MKVTVRPGEPDTTITGVFTLIRFVDIHPDYISGYIIHIILMYFNESHFLSSAQTTLNMLASISQQSLSGALLQTFIAPDEQVDFLFLAGKIVNAYHIRQGKATRLSQGETEQALRNESHRKTQVVPLPPHGLRLYKTYVESRTVLETRRESTENITDLIAEWQSASEPTFATFHWESADALVYLSGKASFTRQAIFVTPEGVESDLYPTLNSWNQSAFSLSLLRSDSKTPAWIEMGLQMAFIHFSGQLITRYRAIGGRNLVDILCKEFNDVAFSQRTDINAFGGTIIDKQLFADAATAARVYYLLLENILEPMETMMGSNLIMSTVKQILESSEAYMLELSQAYKLLPDKYLTAASGVKL